MFEIDGVELEFTDDAIEAVADQALLRGTGARGLRAIMEEVLLPVMFDVPSDDDIARVVVTREVVLDNVLPTIVRREVPSRRASARAQGVRLSPRLLTVGWRVRRQPLSRDAAARPPWRRLTRGRCSWRLGATGPCSRARVTCGSASLTVARMLADPAFARWVVTGVARDGGPADGRTRARRRFAAYEQRRHGPDQRARRRRRPAAAAVAAGARHPAVGSPATSSRRAPRCRHPLRLRVVRVGDADWPRGDVSAARDACATGAPPCCTSATR